MAGPNEPLSGQDADRPGNERGRIRRATKLVLLLGFSLILAAAVLECGARFLLAGTSSQQSIIRPDPELLFDLRPSVSRLHRFRTGPDEWKNVQVRISSQGMRDGEFEAKEASEYRILMLGDSFTFGSTSEIEETIGRQLQSLFGSSAPAKRVVTINAGVHGTGPWQQERILERRGFSFEPDLVLHQVFLGNDLRDMLSRSGRTTHAYEPQWELELHRIRMLPLRRFRAEQRLADHSRAYAAFRDAVGRDRITRFLLRGGGVLKSIEPPSLPPSEARPPAWEVNLKTWYPHLDEAFDGLVETLEKAHKACADRGVQYVVYCVPLPEEIVDTWFDERIRVTGLVGVYEPGKGERLLEERLAALGIPFVPLRDAMREHASPESLYFEHDGHTTPAGNAVIAATLAEYLSLVDHIQAMGHAGVTRL